MTYIIGCNDPDSPLYNPCASELGGVRYVAYKKASYTFADITDPAEWATAQASGDVRIIQRTRGDKPKSSAVKVPGRGNVREENVTREFTLNYMHTEVVEEENVNFYNVMNYSNEFELIYVTETKLWLNAGLVTVDADTVVQEGLNTRVEWNVTVTWLSQFDALAYDIPTGVFL